MAKAVPKYTTRKIVPFRIKLRIARGQTENVPVSLILLESKPSA
jgi:hypothetical protein